MIEPKSEILPAFHPAEHLIQLRNGQKMQDYLPVQWRLVWFRTQFPHGSIETELIKLDLEADTEEEVSVWNPEKRKSEKVIKHGKGIAVFRAVVRDGVGGVGTGTKSEKAASFPDFIEKAETGSIGRALAALGFGTQFAPELNEEHRIVDAPVEPRPERVERPIERPTQTHPPQPAAENPSPLMNKVQSDKINELSGLLNKALPEKVERMTFQEATAYIKKLATELNERNRARNGAQ